LLIAACIACIVAGLPGALSGRQKYAILPPVAVISVEQLHDLIRRDSGNVVLVNAWATWCQPCIEELPRLARLSKEYAEKPLRIILVSADEAELAATSVKKTLTGAGIVLQTYLVAGGGDEYFINSMSPKWSGALPTTFLYDKQGGLRKLLTGKQSYEKFSAAVDTLLGYHSR
jgi:thiol-disulfide isomerase/thioredoxin